MPLAQITLGKGRANHDQKMQLIAKITEVFHEVLGSDKKNVWVVLQEVPRSEWGIDGKPLAEPGK